MADYPVHRVSRRHLEAMTGELGIWQHATGSVPNRAFGYCTDDVARALTVDLAHARVLGWDAVKSSAWRSLHFMRDAYDPADGRLRNFRDAVGGWLPGEASQDSCGRAMLALGGAVGVATGDDFAARARLLFAVSLPASAQLTALRAIASTLLGCAAALESDALEPTLRAAAGDTLRRLTIRLRTTFAPSRTSPAWPWPEPVLTYENPLLPRALVVAGQHTGDDELILTGLRSLDWLIAVQTSEDGWLSPIGSDGFWPRDGARARFDQQPIEATALILAAEVALRQTGDARYLDAIERAYAWFLGHNDVGASMADPIEGACFDGLEPNGVNRNQGAESTLMWLTALERVRDIRRVPVTATTAAARGAR